MWLLWKGIFIHTKDINLNRDAVQKQARNTIRIQCNCLFRPFRRQCYGYYIQKAPKHGVKRFLLNINYIVFWQYITKACVILRIFTHGNMRLGKTTTTQKTYSTNDKKVSHFFIFIRGYLSVQRYYFFDMQWKDCFCAGATVSRVTELLSLRDMVGAGCRWPTGLWPLSGLTMPFFSAAKKWRFLRCPSFCFHNWLIHRVHCAWWVRDTHQQTLHHFHGCIFAVEISSRTVSDVLWHVGSFRIQDSGCQVSSLLLMR